jgi:xanthine dehydrogenase YagT iron-sulfur-binding subunit
MDVDARLRVNGQTYPISVDARSTLLDVLREQLDLTGTKNACDHGQCGSCTVLVNGRRVLTCLSLAAAIHDKEILTIEGVASADNGLHPLQQAFIEHDAFQCGYCTAGQICSALGMLHEVAAGWPSAASPDLTTGSVALTDDEIRERMSGNLCRCGAYPNIVAAIASAAPFCPFTDLTGDREGED